MISELLKFKFFLGTNILPTFLQPQNPPLVLKLAPTLFGLSTAYVMAKKYTAYIILLKIDFFMSHTHLLTTN